MIDAGTGAHPTDGDYVAFRSAGDAVRGQFRCAECGYGVAVSHQLPRCPMCGGSGWEETPPRLLGRPDALP